MANISVINLLSKVFGARGLAFPQKPHTIDKEPITSAIYNLPKQYYNNTNQLGTPIRKYTDEKLGRYEFMPVTINSIDIPNALIIINGEKEIIETNVLGAITGFDANGKPSITGATVFEKAFTKPYEITVIATLIGDNGIYPEQEMWQLTNLWKEDDVVTLKCALTEFFIPKTNNALITKISVLDNAGSENVEVIQFSLRSNIEFNLEIV